MLTVSPKKRSSDTSSSKVQIKKRKTDEESSLEHRLDGIDNQMKNVLEALQAVNSRLDRQSSLSLPDSFASATHTKRVNRDERSPAIAPVAIDVVLQE